MSCKPKCDPSNEPLSSALDNFTEAFFGSITKTCVNNEVVWNLPCNLAQGMAAIPRDPNEGIACYILRLFSFFGLIPYGVWDPNVLYPKNAFVTFNGQGYIALRDTIGEQPDISPTAWQLYIAQGPPGPFGSPLTTKGDIWGYDTADNRIPVGADNTALMADSTQALGVRWGFPPSSDLAANLGAGNGVFAGKSGNTFQFKSLIAGTGITITPTANDLTIASSSSGLFTVAYTSPNQVITAAGALTLAHLLGGMPTLLQTRLKCTTAEFGYSIGDEVIISMDAQDQTISRGVSVVPDAANIVIRYGAAASSFVLIDKAAGTVTPITNANWVFIIRAWR